MNTLWILGYFQHHNFDPYVYIYIFAQQLFSLIGQTPFVFEAVGILFRMDDIENETSTVCLYVLIADCKAFTGAK